MRGGVKKREAASSLKWTYDIYVYIYIYLGEPRGLSVQPLGHVSEQFVAFRLPDLKAKEAVGILEQVDSTRFDTPVGLNKSDLCDQPLGHHLGNRLFCLHCWKGHWKHVWPPDRKRLAKGAPCAHQNTS